MIVRFTDRSAGSPVSWNWSFGNGSFSEEQNPEHLYLTLGSYSVSLTASNGYASDSRTEADYIAAQPSALVISDSLPPPSPIPSYRLLRNIPVIP